MTVIDEEISKLVKIEEKYSGDALYKAQAKIAFLTSLKSTIKKYNGDLLATGKKAGLDFSYYEQLVWKL